MQYLDKIKQYCSSVCDQIRWKKAHDIISKEIENHIQDQKSAFIENGLDELTATDKAIAEMGDPIIVGSQLDRTHRPKPEWSMIILTIFILLVGLAINYFIKSSVQNTPELYYFYKSIQVAVIGTICLIIAYFIDFTIIGKHPVLIFTLLTMFIIICFPFAMQVNGARRWVSLPILGTIHMSVFMLFFPTAYAGVIYAMRNKGYIGIFLCGIAWAIPAFIFFSLNYGVTSVLLYTLSNFGILVIALSKGWFNVKPQQGLLSVFIPTIMILVVFTLPFFGSSFRASRFQVFLNPYIDPLGRGYTLVTTRNILSGAKFFGEGTLPMGYKGDASFWLPNMNTDYVITYLIHRMGWITFFAILLLLISFIARGFYLCSKQKSVLGRLVSTSVLLTFTLQIVIYILANLGFQLFSQLTMPLISYGGMSTVTNLILIGIMLSVFKSGYLVRDNMKIATSGKNKVFELVDGKIVIDLGLK